MWHMYLCVQNILIGFALHGDVQMSMIALKTKTKKKKYCVCVLSRDLSSHQLLASVVTFDGY